MLRQEFRYVDIAPAQVHITLRCERINHHEARSLDENCVPSLQWYRLRWWQRWVGLFDTQVFQFISIFVLCLFLILFNLDILDCFRLVKNSGGQVLTRLTKERDFSFFDFFSLYPLLLVSIDG